MVKSRSVLEKNLVTALMLGWSVLQRGRSKGWQGIYRLHVTIFAVRVTAF